MATTVSSYAPHIYHQSPYLNTTMPLFYNVQPLPNNYYQPSPVRQRAASPITTTTTTTTTEYKDSNAQPLRPRREPRVHRQVILLPTPEPIYRQVRHRLPTPERQVIQRTVIQKANGNVVVQQERHRKKTRSQSRTATSRQTRSSRARQPTTD